MIDDCKKRIPLSPKVMTTKELFEGRRYVIPKYQRDYVWDKEENIKPFVQAIAEGVAKREDVFLGTTLFRETEDGKFEVMDGRQRLTTLAALSELCGESRGSELFDDEAKKEKVKREIEEVFNIVAQDVAIASDALGKRTTPKNCSKRHLRSSCSKMSISSLWTASSKSPRLLRSSSRST